MVLFVVKRYKNSFRIKVLSAIQRTAGAIVLRSDLNELGDSRQISRALRALVEDGELIKFGYGVYVKAQITEYSDEPIMIVTMAEACIEVLERLGIEWELGQAIKDYNKGKTQQLPTKFIIKLKKRFRGQLGTKRRAVVFEGGVNAK